MSSPYREPGPVPVQPQEFATRSGKIAFWIALAGLLFLLTMSPLSVVGVVLLIVSLVISLGTVLIAVIHKIRFTQDSIQRAILYSLGATIVSGGVLTITAYILTALAQAFSNWGPPASGRPLRRQCKLTTAKSKTTTYWTYNSDSPESV